MPQRDVAYLTLSVVFGRFEVIFQSAGVPLRVSAYSAVQVQDLTLLLSIHT